jgi:mannose-6-phosphate isomerase
VGILVSCLLRYKKLPAGECYAIDAGVPHAYLKGSCMEIMKNSDNVVRLGLTPKLKDIPTMLEIMNERIGLDGIKVESFDHGYQWNGLIIR